MLHTSAKGARTQDLHTGTLTFGGKSHRHIPLASAGKPFNPQVPLIWAVCPRKEWEWLWTVGVYMKALEKPNQEPDGHSTVRIQKGLKVGHGDQSCGGTGNMVKTELDTWKEAANRRSTTVPLTVKDLGR